MAGTVLKRVLGDEAIETVRSRLVHFRRSTRAGAIDEALAPVVRKAMDPFT